MPREVAPGDDTHHEPGEPNGVERGTEAPQRFYGENVREDAGELPDDGDENGRRRQKDGGAVLPLERSHPVREK